MAEKRARRSTGPVTKAPRQAPVPAPDDPGGAHAKGYTAEPGPVPAVPADGPVPLANPPADPAERVLSGENPRGEVAGCPTGLTNPPPLQQPGSGTVSSPGKAVNEARRKRSGQQG